MVQGWGGRFMCYRSEIQDQHDPVQIALPILHSASVALTRAVLWKGFLQKFVQSKQIGLLFQIKI
jgi:hypothetical protein